MAKSFRMTGTRRVANRLMAAMVRLGLVPGPTYLLTVVGRKSGQSRTTPVTLVKSDGERWLVAPYGHVDWVHNARAAGRVTLRRGRRTETVDVRELGAEESAPVLRRYLRSVPIVRPYFDAGPKSPLADFVAEAPRHPVFRITESAD